MWSSGKQFGPELFDMTTAPLSLKVRMLRAEVVETLLCGRVTSTLTHKQSVRTAHHRLMRVIGFQRRKRSKPTLVCPKALKRTPCENVAPLLAMYW